eukprot:CAMPEP_0172153076 /NCGR_PEP_ID=MMETSP1050-20130122/1219_1 /TAXON_ID=233186 /ORGANISM="Cryptomonas curvata, Strain CCAP979/52" /LENGTH=255 /DNA_ID=CAMNT_0012821523 /DNA_START=2458 /DNA_END=3227 /DNA_ORIENTATION=-
MTCLDARVGGDNRGGAAGGGGALTEWGDGGLSSLPAHGVEDVRRGAGHALSILWLPAAPRPASPRGSTLPSPAGDANEKGGREARAHPVLYGNVGKTRRVSPSRWPVQTTEAAAFHAGIREVRGPSSARAQRTSAAACSICDGKHQSHCAWCPAASCGSGRVKRARQHGVATGSPSEFRETSPPCVARLSIAVCSQQADADPVLLVLVASGAAVAASANAWAVSADSEEADHHSSFAAGGVGRGGQPHRFPPRLF